MNSIAALADRQGSTARPGHRFYQGERGESGCRVWVAESGGPRFLPGRTSEPLTSYAWGRAGTSAVDLAWAVLSDSTDDPQLADDWCSDFSFEVIRWLPHAAFCLAARDVLAWLDDVSPTFAPVTAAAALDAAAAGLDAGPLRASIAPRPHESGGAWGHA